MFIDSKPVIGIAAFSGTGKTTLLTQLIPMLKARELEIALIKHSHHNFEIDKPGKDSYRLRHAGAGQVMLVSDYRRALMTEFKNPEPPRLTEQLKLIDTDSIDLILVEGFKAENFPKIELHRPVLKKPLLYPDDPSIFAVASDQPLGLPDHLSALDLNQPRQFVDLLMQRYPVLNHD